MNILDIQKLKTKKKRRIGQGHGSGRGKTAGRGTKGQKARGDVPLDFEGGNLPLIKRLPFLRGKGKNKSFKAQPLIVNVEDLKVFEKNAVVDVETLAQHNLVKLEDVNKHAGVKILGDGDLEVPLTVKVRVSKGAEEKIKKAGGTVV